MIKVQNPIFFINDCNALVDYKELENAVLLYAKTPVASKKHIYMHGKYPAVSIHKKKIHIHRLLMMYWLNGDLPNNYFVHHIDENKLNAAQDNLALVFCTTHQRHHSEGKIISDEQKQKIRESNHRRKGKRAKYKAPVTPKQVYEMRAKGYSFNKISQILKLDWSCVKQRYDDFIYDNPELLKGDEKE